MSNNKNKENKMLLLDKLSNKARNGADRTTKLLGRHPLICLLAVLVSISVIVFWQYITTNKIYMFTGIASDSYYQTYPFMYSIIQYVREHKEIPEYLFTMGLGSAAKNTLIFPYNVILLLFNEENFVYAIPYIQMSKIILAGLFYYGYMRERKMTKYTSILMAVSYAFCGHMLLRNMWYTYSIEVMLVALILWGFELFYNKKNVIILPLAMLTMLNTLSIYYTVIYIAIIIGYTIFRYFNEPKSVRTKDNYLKKYILKYTICYLVVITITVLLKREEVLETLLSKRFNDGVNKQSVKTMSYSVISGIKEAVTAFLSCFSVNINIVNGEYRGILNQLDAPTYYCQMITFIFLLMSIHIKQINIKKQVNKDKKASKLVYINEFRNAKKYRKDTKEVTILKLLSLVLISIYTISPIVRYYANGMSSETYKLSSLWITILIMFWASKEIDTWVRKQKIDKEKFCKVVLLCLAFIIISAIINRTDINNIELVKIVLILLLYMVLMATDKISHNVKRMLILLISLIQILTGSYAVINSNGAITKEQYTERINYKDHTKECLDYIKSIDDTKFYRVEKLYYSVYLNDSMVQNYYGTKSYIGGTDFNSDVREFAMSQGGQFLSYGYMYGFYGITETNTYLGVKYVLSKTESIPYYGYELINKIEDIYIYQNKNTLPIGFCYDTYITTKEYENMSLNERRMAILQSVVIDEDDTYITSKIEHKEVDTSKSTDIAINDNDTCLQLVNNEAYTINKNDENTLLRVELQFNSKLEKQGYLYYVSDGSLRAIELIAHKSTNQYVLELNEANIDAIWFNITSYNATDIIDGVVRYTILEKEECYENYEESVKELNENGFVIDSFSDTYITGSIQADTDGVMCFTIPYSKYFTIYVDGVEQELYKTNQAFIGCFIKEGRHTVEIIYKNS